MAVFLRLRTTLNRFWVLRHEVEDYNQVVPEAGKIFRKQFEYVDSGAVPPWDLTIKNQQEGINSPLVLNGLDHLLRILEVISLGIIITLSISYYDALTAEVSALDCLGFGRTSFCQGG